MASTRKSTHLSYVSTVLVITLYFLPHVCIDSSPFPEQVKLAAYRYYNESMTRLHIGQGLDILWHRDKNYFPALDEYMTMCSFKTGALSQLSGCLGVYAGGGSSEVARAMGNACQKMGVGFQILDDVSNLTTGNPGKKRGDDIVEGKKSLPVILCSQLGGDVRRLKEIFRYAGEYGIEKVGDAVEEAIALISSTGAIEKAKEKAFSLLEASRSTIVSSYHQGEVLDLISGLFDLFLKPLKGEK